MPAQLPPVLVLSMAHAGCDGSFGDNMGSTESPQVFAGSESSGLGVFAGGRGGGDRVFGGFEGAGAQTNAEVDTKYGTSMLELTKRWFLD